MKTPGRGPGRNGFGAAQCGVRRGASGLSRVERLRLLVGAVLLALALALGGCGGDVQEEQKDVKEEQKDVKEEQKDVEEAQKQVEEEQKDVEEEQKDVKEEQKDVQEAQPEGQKSKAGPQDGDIKPGQDAEPGLKPDQEK